MAEAKEEKAPAESKKTAVVPELDGGNAMMQKSAPKDTIDVDGEQIPIDTDMTGVVEDDPESADYLQV